MDVMRNDSLARTDGSVSVTAVQRKQNGWSVRYTLYTRKTWIPTFFHRLYTGGPSEADRSRAREVFHMWITLWITQEVRKIRGSSHLDSLLIKW